MTPDEDLIRVTLFALENDDFRQAWETAVRECADGITAMIAGARMAGATGGCIEVCWDDAMLPVPEGFSADMVQGAFRRAVMAEVDRRIEAMTSPGAFG